MSLSELMSSFGLSIFPQVALVLFLFVFLAVVARVLLRRDRDDYAAAARLPLEDDDAPSHANDGGARHG